MRLRTFDILSSILAILELPGYGFSKTEFEDLKRVVKPVFNGRLRYFDLQALLYFNERIHIQNERPIILFNQFSQTRRRPRPRAAKPKCEFDSVKF